MLPRSTGSEESATAFDYILGSITTLVIMAYLVFALIRPERF